MSWLYTIVFAGLMLTAESGNAPVPASNNYAADSKIIAVAPLPDETEKFEQTYPLSANGRVSVSNVNGSIAVDVWDKNEVRLEYVKTADTKESLSDLTVKIEARQDAFSVETDYGDWKRRSSGERKKYNKMQVEYRLTVPRTAVLNEIETVNGSVSVAGASNMTKASSVNGEVSATNLRGTANLSTVNGTVKADFDQLQAGGRISLNTVNGTVDLTIPSDANATIKADTVNGKITNDFNLPVRKGEYVGSDLYGKVGSGDVNIRLNSVNGALSVKRKNDGKNLSPATNLLNMKNENDWDDDADNEDSSSVRPPKPPKPPKAPKTPKAPKPPIGEFDDEAISKSVEDALKQAEKEIERMGPELDKKYFEALRQAEMFNSEEMRARMKEVEARYKDAMARMSDGYFIVGSPAIEKKSGSFVVKGTPKVSVDAKNCAVSVRGWDKSEVSYSIIKISRGAGKSLEKDSAISVKNSDSEVSIKVSEDAATRGGVFGESNQTRVEVFVPKKTDLKIVTNGTIRLEGVSGEIDLQGSENSINVRDSDGKLSVKSDDGRIRVIGFRGAFDGKTTVGAMNLEGDFQKFSAQTVDGTIVLTLPENAKATIESNSKQVVAEGFALEPQGDGRNTSKWKIGGGGTNYLFNMTAGGEVLIRTANALKTN